MSLATSRISYPCVSTAPVASAQTMNASSGSFEWPTRTSMSVSLDCGNGQAGPDGGDPGLPTGDLQARHRRRPRVGDGAREAAGHVGRLGERDGEEARAPPP